MEKILNLDEIVGSADADEVVNSVLATGDFNPTKEIQNVLPYTRRVSANDIVPEEYQHKLMEIDFAMSQCYWLIGDICVDLVESVDREKSRQLGKIISKQDIFESVGLFCHRTGRSVRYYYECARFFSPEIRHKYDVPFSVFAEARWVKDWEVLLQIASENPIMGAEKVRAEYYKQTDEEKQKREKPEVLFGAVIEKDNFGSADVEVGETKFKSTLLSKLDHTVDDLREVLVRIPLPTDLRVRIGDVLLEIQNIQMDIRRVG